MYGMSSLQARHANCVWRRPQERAARKTADSAETQFARNCGLPSLARGGAAPGETEIAGLSRRDRRSSDLRIVVPRYARARASIIVEACAASSCYGPSVLSASTTGRGIAG